MKLPALRQRITSRTLCWLCVAVLLLSLMPLYALSFFNHACYDDFGFSILTHNAVRDGKGFFGAVKAAFDNTVSIRNTWEGTYTTSFISALQPAIFGENLYWISTFVLLTFFLFAVWVFLREVLIRRLKADQTAFWMAFCCVAFTMVQFVPDLSEAFFWFNGGVAYTIMWSLMLVRLTVWLRLDTAERRGAQVGWSLLLVTLTALLGGSKYTTLLFALLADGLLLWYAFRQKRPVRWIQLLCTVLLAALLVFSGMAPGNAVRAATLSGGLSAPMAIAQAMFFGVSLMGHWFSLPLMVVWAVVVWQLSDSLRMSHLRFGHPLLVTAGAICLFCAQLTPTLFTGNYLGDGRTVNTYFFTFVLLSCALVLYWAGWLIRRCESGEEGLPALPKPDRKTVRLTIVAAVVVVLIIGCVSYHPEGTESYGPQNMAAGSALRSMLGGEASAYDTAMDQRDQQMIDPEQTDVILRPVTTIPDAFMGDVPLGEMTDYVQSLYAEYYLKNSVTIEMEEP
ncbi:MAG: hypothetical protein E7319_08450 [Clostridiales bacterium]|nr:hypothetical protein [Clostridiales bacterium]